MDETQAANEALSVEEENYSDPPPPPPQLTAYFFIITLCICPNDHVLYLGFWGGDGVEGESLANPFLPRIPLQYTEDCTSSYLHKWFAGSLRLYTSESEGLLS